MFNQKKEIYLLTLFINFLKLTVMKKKLLMFATAALVLAACSSEDDILQGNGSLTQLGSSGAVTFDTYTSAATKAGDAGVMTTDKLKTAGKGFGVFAFYQDNVNYPAPNTSLAPNFMFNEHVYYSGSWTYSPLKYWPNETENDSQSPAATSTGQVDKLSFFAYAPYVNLTATGTMTVNTTGPVTEAAYIDDAAEPTGILAITKESRTGDPLVEWKYSTNLDQNVDLLWGVAPAGMSYTDVSGGTTTADAGKPLLDMVKPDKDKKMKFLFQHALSRIGLTVVSAIDQVPAGDDGGVYSNAQTRVLIKSVEIYGNFGKQGVLNLNNGTANVANWIAESIDYSEVDGTKLFDITAANGNLNADLRYVDAQITAVNGNADKFAELNTGVLPSETPLLAQGADPSKEATDLSYAFGKALYKLSGSDYVRATTQATSDVDAYTKSGDDYSQAYTSGTGGVTMNGTTKYYQVTEDASLTADGSTHCVVDQVYYVKTGSAGSWEYTKHIGTGTETEGTYYSLSETELSGANYTGTCYTSLVPRYFMVIPTAATDVKIKITYAVVTKDEKLTGNISNVENAITKTTSLTLQSGKSYNLKLILGLTSVKMEASVADWQVDGSNEIYLPQNVAE